ncbi:MAG: hypothetical protein JO317_00285 [Verrucomicrobiae bacterium]|nr:hypothetical protein [Verrucomicrobiae bacterium]
MKIRGFRIEPGEIETVLLRQDGVQEAVVVARTDSRGDDTLAAYVVARGLRAEALREILRQRLPDYLVPATIAVLPELPRLPNGKVDRKRLPEQPTAAAPTGRVPPRNEPERGLLEIWKRVLKQDRLGVTDNFFDLGGHSLLAIRLLSEIQRDLGSTLPLTAIFQAPTVEKFAQLLIDSENSDEAAVLPLQPKGRRPPLFWLHTLGGGGAGGFFRYKKLAELLSPDQPSYGIRAPREPYSELPAMAADYLRKIRKVQPSGPYRLAGYCFGGNLAFEMARQLGAGGEAVDFLGLLECVALPGRSVFARGTLDRPGLKALADISMNTFYWARDLHHQGWRASIERMRDAARRFRSKSRPLEEADADVREVLERWDYPKAFRKHAEAHWRAISRYQPAPYDGSAVLFRVRKQRLKHFDRALGWGDFLRGGVEVRIVSGKHDSIFDEPHVRELAASLQACLDKLA